ncbi:hypothetical protein CMI48_00675 [Candidatus Pacearchaeota archaeon]|nr:hypothetical protein [Candidatus Pacearchaeota archaeon]
MAEVKEWDDEASKIAGMLYAFLSQSDISELPDDDQNVAIANSSNWYNRHAAGALEILTRKYAEAPVFLAGGVGTRSSARARELGGEAPEVLEYLVEQGSELDEERVTTYVEGEHTRGNMEWVAEQVDPEATLVGYEAAALPQRSKATLKGAVERAGKENKVYMINAGPGGWEEFLSMHGGRTDVAAEVLVEEIDRLHKYAIDEPPKFPAAFTEEQAWAGADKFGGKANLQAAAEILKQYYDAEGLKAYHKALDGDEGSGKAEALEVLAPVPLRAVAPQVS